MSLWRGIGRGFVHQQPPAISEKKMGICLHPFMQVLHHNLPKAVTDIHVHQSSLRAAYLQINKHLFQFFPFLFLDVSTGWITVSWLQPYKSTASQGKELGTKPTVRLRLKGPNRGDLGNGLAWQTHESNTQQPLQWPLTVPGNQKSTSQGLEAPPSQPCKEERQRADPATSENKIIVNCNLHSLSGFAARQERNLVPVHGAQMRIAHQK